MSHTSEVCRFTQNQCLHAYRCWLKATSSCCQGAVSSIIKEKLVRIQVQILRGKRLLTSLTHLPFQLATMTTSMISYTVQVGETLFRRKRQSKKSLKGRWNGKDEKVFCTGRIKEHNQIAQGLRYKSSRYTFSRTKQSQPTQKQRICAHKEVVAPVVTGQLVYLILLRSITCLRAKKAKPNKFYFKG